VLAVAILSAVVARRMWKGTFKPLFRRRLPYQVTPGGMRALWGSTVLPGTLVWVSVAGLLPVSWAAKGETDEALRQLLWVLAGVVAVPGIAGLVGVISLLMFQRPRWLIPPPWRGPPID
jgi:hypothetical protein